MSRVNWILVANDTACLPGPLLARCRVVRLSAPSVAEERAFVLRVAGEKLGRERGGLLAEAIARKSGGCRGLLPGACYRALKDGNGSAT